MNILFGAIPVIAFMVLLGYKKSDKVSNKVICMQLPFVVIGIIAFWFYMIKCYEVPIHHNRISYMLMTNNTDYSYFTGNTAIDIVYDYNRQKGLKELSYGYPKDTKPRVEIESYIEGHRKAEKPQFFSSTPSLKIHKVDTINYDVERRKRERRNDCILQPFLLVSKPREILYVRTIVPIFKKVL